MKPVYALVGADSFLQLEELRRILKEVGEGVQRVDVEGEKAELAEVLDEVRSFAMFGAGKLVVVRDAGEFVTRFREQMEDYCARPSDSAVLVMRFDSLPGNQRIAKAIGKTGEIRKCEPPRDVVKWTVERARSVHGLKIGRDAAETLRELLGDDLGKIDNELAKLAIQNDGGQVGAEAVADNVTFQREQEIKELTAALAEGRPLEALTRWRRMVETDASAEYRAVTWLGMWLDDVRTFLTEPGSFRNGWRYKEKLGQFQQSARAIGKERVGRLIELLAEADYRSKTGVGDAVENVERFILAVAGGK